MQKFLPDGRAGGKVLCTLLLDLLSIYTVHLETLSRELPALWPHSRPCLGSLFPRQSCHMFGMSKKCISLWSTHVFAQNPFPWKTTHTQSILKLTIPCDLWGRDHPSDPRRGHMINTRTNQVLNFLGHSDSVRGLWLKPESALAISEALRETFFQWDHEPLGGLFPSV